MKRINVIFLSLFIAILIGCQPKEKLKVKITKTTKTSRILNDRIAILDSVEVFRNETVIIKPDGYSKDEVFEAFKTEFATIEAGIVLKLSETKRCADCNDAIFVIEGAGLENYTFQLSPGNGAACQSGSSSSCGASGFDLIKNLAFFQQKPPVKPQISTTQTNKDEIIVAILDSGIDPNDTFIKANASKILPGINVMDGSTNITDVTQADTSVVPTDFSPQRHGTKIAKIILNQTDGGNIKILPIKIVNTCPGNLFDALCGIYTAQKMNAKILNLSWNYKATDEIRSLTSKVFKILDDKKIYVSTAAGNDNLDLTTSKLYSVCFSDELKNLYGVTTVFTDTTNGNYKLYGNASKKFVKIGVNSLENGFFNIPNDSLSKGTSYATAFFTAHLFNNYPYILPTVRNPKPNNIPDIIITP